MNWFILTYSREYVFSLPEEILYLAVMTVSILEIWVILYLIDHFLSKPVRDLEYKMKSFWGWRYKNKKDVMWQSSNEHIDYVLGSMDQLLVKLKNIKWELRSGRAIKSEVDLTQEIQEKLFKKKLDVPPSFDIIARSKPANEIGWDSFDVIKQDNNYYIYVWDVTGHGVASWFVMMMVNALISWFSKVFKKWNQILGYTNEILKPRIKTNMLMSLLMVRWNEEEKRLFMTWAGHEYLIIYKASQDKCFKIKSWWIALWMAKNIHKLIKEQEIKFEEDDILILYSDWITEAKTRLSQKWNEWKMFGEDMLVSAINNAPKINTWTKNIKTAKSVFNNISSKLSIFIGYNHIQFDDITLLVAHYKWDNVINDNSPLPEAIDWTVMAEWTWQ